MPDFGVDKIEAKIDTGAKSSALHATRIRRVDHEGHECAEFFVHPRQGEKKPEVFCVAPLVDTRIIRSSNGEEEERYVVSTTITLGDEPWSIDLTLTNRDAMGFRLLVGRDALGRKFIVDPGAANLLGGDE